MARDIGADRVWLEELEEISPISWRRLVGAG
jgi:hypothetical protein